MDIEDIIGYEALWKSMEKCRRGVIWKDSVAHYVLNGVEETRKLEQALHDGSYRERSHKYFRITSPKPRDIMSISFRDRVYQRSLNDVGIYPAMARGFIYDNCACQKGKGADFARERFKCHLQRFYRKHGRNGCCLKMDVKGYYPNMRHDTAKEVFKKRLDPAVYERAAAILDGFPGEVGFNPGSQIIQIAGISVLDGVDHMVKERLRVKQYIRYMDDMLAVVETEDDARRIMTAVEEKLNEIGFELHRGKTRVIPLTEKIMFLGFDYRLTETGKVLMTLDPERVRAERRKLRRLVCKAKEQGIDREKVDESYRSWRSHAAKGNTHGMITKMDAYYDGLWRNGNEDHTTDVSPHGGGQGEPA